MTRILLALLAVLALVGPVQAGETFLGVQGGGIFGSEDFGEEGAVLTGDVAYAFDMGLWIEYEGGGLFGEDDFADHSWTRLGWRAVSRGASDLYIGVMRLDVTDEDGGGLGGWGSLVYDMTESTSLRVTLEAQNDLGAKVGWYLRKKD